MSKCRTICVANQKGGVGKTTTAVNLAASLAAAEYRTLLLDCDPQANATSGVGQDPADLPVGLYEVLTEAVNPEEVLQPTDLELLRLLPASTDLVGVEIEFVDLADRQSRLAAVTRTLSEVFDYIIIDCPPSLGLLTLNALVAADSVLIPLQCEYYAMEGLSRIIGTINRVRQAFNPRLNLEGVLLTMYDQRTNLSLQVAEEVRRHFNDKVFKTHIPRNVRLSESPSFGKPVLLYDIRSPGAQAYLALAQELISHHRPEAAS